MEEMDLQAKRGLKEAKQKQKDRKERDSPNNTQNNPR